MALRDFWRNVRGGREHEHERERYPLDPLSRDSWHDESEARYGSQFYRDFDGERRPDPDYERRQFNDRSENSYSGPGYGRFGSERGESDEYGGSSGNPFYGDRPLLRAGSTYDSSYFGSQAGLPRTQWQHEANPSDFDDLVYGGRNFDADASSEARGHRGRGPRGYSRSDERIKEDVCQCLTDDHYVDASEIDVAVTDREVVLSGTVSSRVQKRRAEELIERLPGVRDVINSLRVST